MRFQAMEDFEKTKDRSKTNERTNESKEQTTKRN